MILTENISNVALLPLERMLDVVRHRCAQIFRYTDALQVGQEGTKVWVHVFLYIIYMIIYRRHIIYIYIIYYVNIYICPIYTCMYVYYIYIDYINIYSIFV